jgi:hypothetical protein
VTEKPAFDCARDWHLFGPGPKRILALDGGAVRGAITVAFLERIEDILSKRLGKEIRLGDWFDLVGGTSTGSLIAGALALRISYRADQGLLPAPGATCLSADPMGHSALPGEVQRRWAARRTIRRWHCFRWPPSSGSGFAGRPGPSS